MPSAPDPIDLEVGSRVRILRKGLKMSQSELARALGLTFQQVQKYERGANRISASMLVKTAQKLGASVSELVGEDGEVKKPSADIRNLSLPGAADLLRAYAALPGGARQALVAFASTMAQPLEALQTDD